MKFTVLLLAALVSFLSMPAVAADDSSSSPAAQAPTPQQNDSSAKKDDAPTTSKAPGVPSAPAPEPTKPATK